MNCQYQFELLENLGDIESKAVLKATVILASLMKLKAS